MHPGEEEGLSCLSRCSSLSHFLVNRGGDKAAIGHHFCSQISLSVDVSRGQLLGQPLLLKLTDRLSSRGTKEISGGATFPEGQGWLCVSSANGGGWEGSKSRC